MPETLNGPTLTPYRRRLLISPVTFEQVSVRSPGRPNVLSMVLSGHELSPGLIPDGIGTTSARFDMVNILPAGPSAYPVRLVVFKKYFEETSLWRRAGLVNDGTKHGIVASSIPKDRMDAVPAMALARRARS